MFQCNLLEWLLTLVSAWTLTSWLWGVSTCVSWSQTCPYQPLATLWCKCVGCVCGGGVIVHHRLEVEKQDLAYSYPRSQNVHNSLSQWWQQNNVSHAQEVVITQSYVYFWGYIRTYLSRFSLHVPRTFILTN